MVEDTSREEIFGFRIMSLTDDQITALRESLPEVPLTIRRRGVSSVVSFDVVEATGLEGLYKFLSQEAIAPDSYSVWISVVTSSDHSGVSVPKYIRDLIRRTGGGIDFSFTAALGDS